MYLVVCRNAKSCILVVNSFNLILLKKRIEYKMLHECEIYR